MEIPMRIGAGVLVKFVDENHEKTFEGIDFMKHESHVTKVPEAQA